MRWFLGGFFVLCAVSFFMVAIGWGSLMRGRTLAVLPHGPYFAGLTYPCFFMRGDDSTRPTNANPNRTPNVGGGQGTSAGQFGQFQPGQFQPGQFQPPSVSAPAGPAPRRPAAVQQPSDDEPVGSWDLAKLTLVGWLLMLASGLVFLIAMGIAAALMSDATGRGVANRHSLKLPAFVGAIATSGFFSGGKFLLKQMGLPLRRPS